MAKVLGTVGFEEEVVQPDDLTGLATKTEVSDERTARETADAALAEAVSLRTSIADMGDGKWRISDITYDTRKQQVLFG